METAKKHLKYATDLPISPNVCELLMNLGIMPPQDTTINVWHDPEIGNDDYEIYKARFYGESVELDYIESCIGGIDELHTKLIQSDFCLFIPSLQQIRTMLYQIGFNKKSFLEDVLFNIADSGEYEYRAICSKRVEGQEKQQITPSPKFKNANEVQAAAELLVWVLQNVEGACEI